MEKLYKYNHFLLEKEFESIINDIFKITESNGKWTGDKTYEWDLGKGDEKSKNKLESFLSKLPKEEIKKYFIKFLNKLKHLPSKIRKFFIINYASIFLTIGGSGYLLSPSVTIDPELKSEIMSATKVESKGVSFNKAQNLVHFSEKGYSTDKKDRGNWIKTKNGKIFIGTKYGISAVILQEFLGRIPTKKEMENLSYSTALKIYKNKFWDKQNLSEFNNQSIVNIIYDGCVNQGIKKTKDVLISALSKNGIDVNSNPFDSECIKKANKLNQEELFNSIKSEREKRYRESITFKRHGKGWLKRLNSIIYQENENLTYEISEHRIPISDQDSWKKLLPKELKIITSNGDFTLKPDADHNTVIDHMTTHVLYTHHTPDLHNGDVLADGEPDTLEFDLRFVKGNNGTTATTKNLKLNVDITYGDAMMFEFTISPPNKIKVGHYTSVHSKYDSETIFAFSDDSIKKLVEFFNRFSNEYKLTPKDFKFLDADPDSYTPDYSVDNLYLK